MMRTLPAAFELNDRLDVTQKKQCQLQLQQQATGSQKNGEQALSFMPAVTATSIDWNDGTRRRPKAKGGGAQHTCAKNRQGQHQGNEITEFVFSALNRSPKKETKKIIKNKEDCNRLMFVSVSSSHVQSVL
jgi:hypothetical protein